MTKVKITHRDGYRCAPYGHTVETFAFGDIVDGRAAELALAAGAASPLFPEMETKPAAPVQIKRGRPRKARS